MFDDQPTLFDAAVHDALGKVRHDHPDTSHEAARAVMPKTGTQRRAVLDFVSSRQEHGATDLEIQHALVMNGNTERPRRIELVEAGYLVDSGLRRRTGGRDMIVWVREWRRDS